MRKIEKRTVENSINKFLKNVPKFSKIYAKIFKNKIIFQSQNKLGKMIENNTNFFSLCKNEQKILIIHKKNVEKRENPSKT